MNVLNRMNKFLNRMLIYFSGFCLILMVVLTCANILFRIFWKPIPGTFELMGLLGAIMAAFALGSTQIKKENISVDILFNTFPAKLKFILNTINDLACMTFFSIAAWQLVKWATILLKEGELTETLRIIYYPFVYGAALGCGILAFGFFIDLFNSLFPQEDAVK